jgi:hypothetical protein
LLLCAFALKLFSVSSVRSVVNSFPGLTDF